VEANNTYYVFMAVSNSCCLLASHFLFALPVPGWLRANIMKSTIPEAQHMAMPSKEDWDAAVSNMHKNLAVWTPGSWDMLADRQVRYNAASSWSKLTQFRICHSWFWWSRPVITLNCFLTTCLLLVTVLYKSHSSFQHLILPTSNCSETTYTTISPHSR